MKAVNTVLNAAVNYIMSDKDRVTLIVNHLRDNPDRAYMLNEIIVEHGIIMNEPTRRAIWDMIAVNIILWYPNGTIQYNRDWKAL